MTDKDIAESIRRCIGNLNDQLGVAAQHGVRVEIEAIQAVVVNGIPRTTVSAEIAKVL